MRPDRPTKHPQDSGGGAVRIVKDYWWAVIGLLLVLLLKKTIVSALLILLLLALGIASTLSSRLFGYNAGIELITFATVVLAYAYGPFAALLAAALMIFCSSLLAGRIADPITIGRYGTYIVLCILAGAISGLEVSTGGKIVAVAYNILMWAVYAMVRGFSLVKGGVPVAINLVLNFFLFSAFAPGLVEALR
jgi:hypothetical protein